MYEHARYRFLGFVRAVVYKETNGKAETDL